MRQKSLLEFLPKGYECKYCNRRFETERGLKIHCARAHFFYHDESVEVVEVDEGHVQLNVKMRKTLFHDLMKTVERSGVDLCRFLLEAFIKGDFLFDREVQKYAAQKTWQEICAYLQDKMKKGEKPTYIL